jgi:hypothetical protein
MENNPMKMMTLSGLHKLNNIDNIKYLADLEDLKLYNLTELTELGNKKFENNAKLESLIIKNTNVKIYKTPVFEGLVNLLNLQIENDLPSLTSQAIDADIGIFKTCKNLKQIRFVNSICEFKDGFFTIENPNIEAIYFDGSSCENPFVLSKGSFSKKQLDGVEQLMIRSTSMTSTQLLDELVHDFTNLKLLDLSHNKMTELYDHLGNIPDSVEQLFLSGNDLIQTGCHTWRAIHKLKKRGIDVVFDKPHASPEKVWESLECDFERLEDKMNKEHKELMALLKKRPN